MAMGYFRKHPLLKYALYAFGIGGVVGVLVDLDHVLAYYGFVYTQDMWQYRPLHIPLAVVAGIVGVYSCSRLRRLVAGVVLKHDQK